MRITDKINEAWGEYDKTVGRTHLENWGIIFLDEYGCPVDNEFDLEELAKEAKVLFTRFSEKALGKIQEFKEVDFLSILKEAGFTDEEIKAMNLPWPWGERAEQGDIPLPSEKEGGG